MFLFVCTSPAVCKICLLTRSQFSLIQSCPTPCNPMNHSTPGLPVHHQLPEFTQTHIHQVSDATQRSNCQHPLDHGKSKRVPEKHLFLLYWLCQSLWLDHNKLWKILKEMGILDHLICLVRNLYAGQEATVRTGHGTTDWFQIGNGVCQGCILSPSLFNFFADFTTNEPWNFGQVLQPLCVPVSSSVKLG